MSLERTIEATSSTSATAIQRTDWMLALYHMIASDIDILLETPEKLVLTLNKIIKQEPDFLTGDRDFDDYLTHTHDALTLHSPQSKLYELITQREKTNNTKKTSEGKPIIPLPSSKEVRAYALISLREICAERGLKITADNMPIYDVPHFIPSKHYVFEEIMSLLDIHLTLFGLSSSSKKDALILLLSSFAGLPDFALNSITISHSRNLHELMQLPDGRNVIMRVKEKVANAFYLNFNTNYSAFNQFSRFCNKAAADNETIVQLSTDEDSYETYMLIKPTIKLLSSPEFRLFLKNFFDKPNVLKNLELYLTDKNKDFHTAHSNLTANINQLGKKYFLNVTSDLLEVALLQAYDITSPCRILQFQPAQRYDAFMTNTDFYLDITKEQAQQFVVSINKDFPDAASVIQYDVLLPGRDSIPLQLITIPYTVTSSQAFLEKISASINAIVEGQSKLFKKLSFDSSAQFFYDFHYTYSSYTNLSQSLLELYRAISGRKSMQDIEDANFEVTKALAALENMCADESNYAVFKKSIKLAIKTLQTRVGLRAVKTPSLENTEEKIAGETVLQKLHTLSEECKEATPELSEAIVKYSEAVTSTAGIAKAKFGLRQAIADVESKCFSQDQHTLFKSSLKRPIKSLLQKQEVEKQHGSSTSAVMKK